MFVPKGCCSLYSIILPYSYTSKGADAFLQGLYSVLTFTYGSALSLK